MKQTHTRRDKGRAVFLAALMVLSVFAMSASFAGAAAADATEVSISPEEVDLAEDDTDIEVTVTHESTDDDVAIAIVDENGDMLVDDEQSNDDDSETTTFDDIDVGDWDTGTYTVYAEAGSEVSSDDLSADNNDVENTFDIVDSTPEEQTGDEPVSVDDRSLVWQGQALESDTFDEDEEVQLREGTADEPGSLVSELSADDGTVSFSSDDLDGNYVLVGEEDDDNGDATTVEFEVAEQSLNAEWNVDSVSEGDEADLEIDSNRASYAVNVESDDLDQSDIASMFGADDDAYILETDDGIQVHHSGDTELSASFDDIDAGEYEFSVNVVDTTAEDEASIKVMEVGDADASFDQSVYQEHAGDVAEFTVELDNTDSALVEIEEEDGNYDALLEVEDGDDDGEVTVYFNTYHAGDDDADVFYVGEDSDDSVELVEQNAAFDDDQRLLPASLDMTLYVNYEIEEDDNDNGEDEGVEFSGDRVDLATLILKQGSLDDAATGVAPKDADLETVEDITDNVTKTDEVAEEDHLVFAFEASGIFGHLDDVGITPQDDTPGEGYFSLLIEQTNNQYDDGQDLSDVTDYEIVQDPENDRFFVVIENHELEAEGEYMVTFEVDEEYPYFGEDDKKKKDFGTSVSTEFTVVERSVEFIGLDKEDTLRVAISDEAKISGEATAAPGSDIRVQIEDSGDSPFLMHDTVEVESDGTFTATFDTSDQKVDQEFTATAIDLLASGDVSTTVDAIFIADEKKDKEDEKKDDDAKDDDDMKDKDDDDAIVGDDSVDAVDDGADDDDDTGAPSDDQPGFGIAVALLALLAAAGFALRRQ